MDKLREIQQNLPVIILTAYGTIEKAVDAMKHGACTYLTKPFEGLELVQQIATCLEKSRFLPNPMPPAAGAQPPAAFARIIARSGRMKTAIAKVTQAAGTDSNVYIEGESGTGKELIACCLHAASPRKDGPFIAINCAAIPENLLESELMGFEKGAFTSADRRREGLFARAHGGSFFFDEISELPLPMQAKLLRILEEREFYPLGSNRKVKVDVRIIAAFNCNLEDRINAGLFRKDLFYRIHVIPISLPALRERKEDILPLARHFLAEFAKESEKAVKDLSPSAVRKLVESDWTGNVRELENVMEYAMAMATGDVITPDLIAGLMSEIGDPPPLRDAKETLKTRDWEFVRDRHTVWKSVSTNPYTVLMTPLEETLHIALREHTEKAIRKAVAGGAPVASRKDIEKIVEDWLSVEEAIVGGLVYKLAPDVVIKRVPDLPAKCVQADLETKAGFKKYRLLPKAIELVESFGLKKSIGLYARDPAAFRTMLTEPGQIPG
jgi:two-component system response regulator GlrR